MGVNVHFCEKDGDILKPYRRMDCRVCQPWRFKTNPLCSCKTRDLAYHMGLLINHDDGYEVTDHVCQIHGKLPKRRHPDG